jgi:hypothetical protein
VKNTHWLLPLPLFQKNHLSGLRSKFILVSFPSTAELGQFKRDLMPKIRKNRLALEQATDYTTMLAESAQSPAPFSVKLFSLFRYMGAGKSTRLMDDGPLDQIVDIRCQLNFEEAHQN